MSKALHSMLRCLMVNDQFGNARLVKQQGEIRIFENSQYRWLCFDDEQAIQSCMLKAEPEKLVLPYQQGMMLWPLFQNHEIAKVCFIGLGGGDLIRYFQNYYPRTQLLAVDNNADMVRLATEHFSLQPAANKLVIEIAEAKRFITNNNKFDLMFIDIVKGTALPECLFKPYFWDRCASSLNENGIVIVNCIAKGEADFVTVLKQIRQSFGYVPVCMDVPEHKNIVLFIPARESQIPTATELNSACKRLQKNDGIAYQTWIEILKQCNRERFELP